MRKCQQQVNKGSTYCRMFVFDCIRIYAYSFPFFWLLSITDWKKYARERGRECIFFWAQHALATLDHDCSKCHKIQGQKGACDDPIYMVNTPFALHLIASPFLPPVSHQVTMRNTAEMTLKETAIDIEKISHSLHWLWWIQSDPVYSCACKKQQDKVQMCQ